MELTKDTLVYAKSKQDTLSGNIQVFAIHEISSVKKEEDKFTVGTCCLR